MGRAENMKRAAELEAEAKRLREHGTLEDQYREAIKKVRPRLAKKIAEANMAIQEAREIAGEEGIPFFVRGTDGRGVLGTEKALNRFSSMFEEGDEDLIELAM